jgi:hypothetical protein
MLFHAHAALCRGLEKPLSERHGRDMAREQHERGMACVNQTRPHCVNQMGKTPSKPLAARHGRGTAWERHGVCELDFTHTNKLMLYSLFVFRITQNTQLHCVGMLN